MVTEMCTKMLKKLSEKLKAQFPATACGYSMVKIARLDCTFLEVFECEARPFERKEEKGKAQTILKVEKPNGIGHFLVQNFDFCTCLSPNALERDASKKKGLLSCCRSLFV